jgi:hypothetical protein
MNILEIVRELEVSQMRTLLLCTSGLPVTALLVLLTGNTLADENDILNVPPPGFTALFNGRDFTGWRMSPQAKGMWLIEDRVLKSPGLLRQWVPREKSIMSHNGRTQRTLTMALALVACLPTLMTISPSDLTRPA